MMPVAISRCFPTVLRITEGANTPANGLRTSPTFTHPIPTTTALVDWIRLLQSTVLHFWIPLGVSDHTQDTYP